MKILVSGPAWVGDMVMAQSLFKELRRRYPNAAIDVLAPGWTLPLLYRMPEIDRAVEVPIGHGELGLAKRIRVAAALSGGGYEWAIITQRSWKAALIPFLAGVPVRTGYRGQWRYPLLNDQRKLDKSKLPRTVQRLVALGGDSTVLPPSAIPSPELQVDSENRQRIMDALGLGGERPVITLFPGAEYGPAKQWPLEYFKELAEGLAASGCQVWVLGGPNDLPVGQFIASGNCGHIHNLIGRTRLEDAVDLISLSVLSVTNDSGLMHVAAALGVQVEVLYGSSTPDYTPPLTEKKTIHYLGLSCSPCFRRECPLGHKNCLNQITVARVMNSIERHLH